MTEETAHKQALVVKDKWEEIITDAFRFGYLTNDLCLGCGKVGCMGCPAGTYTGWHPSIRNKGESMIEEDDPIKALWKHYTGIMLRNDPVGSIPQKIVCEIVDKMIDAAYAKGVCDASNLFEKTVWDMKLINKREIDLIQEAQKIIKDYNTK